MESVYEIFLGLDTTHLVFEDWLGDMIYSFNVSKVTVKDLHLTRSSPGTTQGFVRSVRRGQVVLDIPPGTLSPAEISFVRPSLQFLQIGRLHLMPITPNTNCLVKLICPISLSTQNTLAAH